MCDAVEAFYRGGELRVEDFVVDGSGAGVLRGLGVRGGEFAWLEGLTFLRTACVELKNFGSTVLDVVGVWRTSIGFGRAE